MYFVDGGCPTDEILNQFIAVATDELGTDLLIFVNYFSVS